MRFEMGLLCMAVFVAGCANSKAPAHAAVPPDQMRTQPTYITPDLKTVGRVELVNTQGRFVVISFPPGHVPPSGQHWRITHAGLQIGEVTISGPQREVDTVADIVDGTANVGDEATAE
jgi:hypothetical protein